MSADWQHQIRVYLPEHLADLARTNRDAPQPQPLTAILNEHRATLVSQLDAFESYVAEAEKADPETFPLYKWTKATVDDPDKRLKHEKSFAVRISGQEVYAKEDADSLEAALRPLAGGSLVTSISRHDTNPANNLAVPPEYRS